MIIAGDDKQEIEDLKNNLKRKFEMQDMGDLKHFLGINIRRNKEGLYLSQNNYLQALLKRFEMLECKESKTPMDPTSITLGSEAPSPTVIKPVRELIGCLMYVMLATRPDLSATVNICSRQQSNPIPKNSAKISKEF